MDVSYWMSIPEGYQKALAITPKITGSLSMLGSSWIIYEVLSDKKKRKSMYHRILLCLSLSDLNCSFWVYFLSSWMLPTNVRSSNRDNTTFFGSVGTWGTCDLQGFMFQLGVATPLYNGVLSLYYLLLLRYNWTPKQIARKLERYLHPTIGVFALGTAIIALLLDLYNPSLASWCTVTEFPYNCYYPTNSTLFSKENQEEQGSNLILSLSQDGACLRGHSEVFATLFQWILLFGPIWLMIGFTTVNMILVNRTVRRQERKMETKYKFHNLSLQKDRQQHRGTAKNEKNNNKLPRSNKQRESERIFTVSVLYTSSFYCTFGFYTLLHLIGLIHGIYISDLGWIIPLTVINNILLPLQGVFNFIIYLFPRYQNYREKRRREIIAMKNRNQSNAHGDNLQKATTKRKENALTENRDTRDGSKDTKNQTPLGGIEKDQVGDDITSDTLLHNVVENSHLRVKKRHSSRRAKLKAECNLTLHCMKDTLQRGWKGSTDKDSHTLTLVDDNENDNQSDDQDYKLGCDFTNVSDEESRSHANVDTPEVVCPIDNVQDTNHEDHV